MYIETKVHDTVLGSFDADLCLEPDQLVIRVPRFLSYPIVQDSPNYVLDSREFGYEYRIHRVCIESIRWLQSEFVLTQPLLRRELQIKFVGSLQDENAQLVLSWLRKSTQTVRRYELELYFHPRKWFEIRRDFTSSCRVMPIFYVNTFNGAAHQQYVEQMINRRVIKWLLDEHEKIVAQSRQV